MTVFIIFISIIVPIVLYFVFGKKIQNKTYKFCINSFNLLLSVVFIIVFFILGLAKNYLNKYIDIGISKIEVKINEIYPNVLEKQMDTEELKLLLEESLVEDESSSLETIAENIIKSKIKKYTSETLKTINALERENNKLSVKDALLSIKEISLNSINPYLKILKIVIIILYIILVIVSVLFTLYLIKDKDSCNEGIIFGDEADKTFIGMKTE